MSEIDWLSHLLQIVSVSGRLEVRSSHCSSHVRQSGAPAKLADLCGMSRASFMRHFQDKAGLLRPRSADWISRMSLAASELKKKPTISTEAVAETVGYQSVLAFRRVFTERMGMTPGEWRRRPADGFSGSFRSAYSGKSEAVM